MKPMKKKPTTDLTDYHKARNERMVRKVSEQPLLSPEESIEQIRRIARQSTQNLVKPGD